MSEPIPREARAYYDKGREAERLFGGHGVIELARTQEIILRHLSPPPGTVLDVGGGSGVYACWLASCRLGDARRLDEPEASAEAVLLLGPLYHLTERAERIQALREAVRVLKPGGLLVAAAVGRFASLLDGIVDCRYFTTAFFHLPRELEDEVREAGFERVEILGLEGPGWMLADLEARWADPARRRHILDAARAIEREPTLMGLHAHILAVGRKPT